LSTKTYITENLDKVSILFLDSVNRQRKLGYFLLSIFGVSTIKENFDQKLELTSME
jgi:hypothetical protein